MIVHGVKVDRVSQTVYLGDIISQDGTNTSNVKDRVAKGIGQVNNIMTHTLSMGCCPALSPGMDLRRWKLKH